MICSYSCCLLVPTRCLHSSSIHVCSCSSHSMSCDKSRSHTHVRQIKCMHATEVEKRRGSDRRKCVDVVPEAKVHRKRFVHGGVEAFELAWPPRIMLRHQARLPLLSSGERERERRKRQLARWGRIEKGAGTRTRCMRTCRPIHSSEETNGGDGNKQDVLNQMGNSWHQNGILNMFKDSIAPIELG